MKIQSLQYGRQPLVFSYHFNISNCWQLFAWSSPLTLSTANPWGSPNKLVYKESLHLIQCFPLFAVARWCKQLPVTVSLVVFINATITVHLPSVSAATIHCGAAQHLSCVLLMCFHWSLPVFHYMLCLLFETVVQACAESWCAAVHREDIKVQRYSLYLLYYTTGHL